jgi:hypothetical protein
MESTEPLKSTESLKSTETTNAPSFELINEIVHMSLHLEIGNIRDNHFLRSDIEKFRTILPERSSADLTESRIIFEKALDDNVTGPDLVKVRSAYELQFLKYCDPK